jgi:hypothetical protein
MSKLTLINKNVDHVGVFGMARQEIGGIQHIHTFDRVICLFEVRRLVVSGDAAFWQTNLLQIKQCSNNTVCDVKQCMIVDRASVSWDVSKFVVYDRMQRLGIHTDAIKHKMKLDGLGDDFFECWSKRKDSKMIPTPSPPLPTLPPLPPPPPPPIVGLALTKSTMLKRVDGPLAFLKDISNGNFALRKSKGEDVGDVVKVTMNKKIKGIEFTPPSLQQIQGALMNLKKISIFDK